MPQKKQHAFILFFLEGNLLAFGILHETSPPQRSNDDVDTNDILQYNFILIF